MNGTDRSFALGTLLLTAVVPGSLLALEPFAEARASFGVLSGWAAALLVLLPGYVFMRRAMAGQDARAFVRAFMIGTSLRLALTVAATLAFALLVPEPPLKSFVLTFFAGYALLMALELRLAVRPQRKEASP
jgi:hypothetical protein